MKRLGGNVSIAVTRHHAEFACAIVGRLWIDAEALRLALPDLARAVDPFAEHRTLAAHRRE